ncbi:hypothetical protein HNP40_003635 [Mycobacteroides chelonae]|nr:hypothetical protein [Mycobacteroides chelonae]
MITDSEWQGMQSVRIAALLCLVPVLLYRIWRVWRYPSSLPAKAVTGFGVLLWFWLLAFTDAVWSVLPTWLRAASAGGFGAVTLAACLQAFILGISRRATSVRIRRDMWVVAATATCVLVVVAIATAFSDKSLMLEDAYQFTNVLMEGSDTGLVVASVTSSTYVAVVLVQLIWIGARNANRTPTGIGLGVLSAGSAVELAVLVFVGIWAPLARGGLVTGNRVGPWLLTVPACGVTALVIVGFLYPPVSLYFRARRAVRTLRPLRDTLRARFPGLAPPIAPAARLPDLVFEWSTHIQDGLTLLAQTRGLPLSTDAEIPSDEAERADSVTDWLIGQEVPGFSAEWLHAPGGMDDETWVLAIADVYRERQNGLEAPASLSGMPSTLRK